MKISFVLKLLIIFGVFGVVYFFWFSKQVTITQDSSISDNDVHSTDELPSYGGGTTSEVTSSPIEENESDDAIENIQPMTPSNIVTNSPSATSETDLLKKAFATKYGKDVTTIFVSIDAKEGAYIKGGVDLDNSGYPATFYAAKISNSSNWEIVAVENGVIACSLIDSYSFPSRIIPQCYSYSTGTVVNR